MRKPPKENATCVCPACKNNTDFRLDDFLLAEVATGEVVLFVGAGVSTENEMTGPHSLYDQLAVKASDRSGTAFPDLAQKVADQPDGSFALLKMTQHHFDYISKWSDLRHYSTKFFQELATMPYFRTFITTNWDRHLETTCHAKPFVYDPDMRFWEIPHRKVLKIHGTIDDYSSMVITRADYNRCARDLSGSLLGSKFKELLSTKTCIFVGYSMKDDDFNEVFLFVRQALGKFPKTHFFVSPYAEDNFNRNIIPIKTDGAYFLRVLKEHMCSNHCYLRDDVYLDVLEELANLLREHDRLWDKYAAKEHPQILLSGSYQDGLIHAYKIMLDTKGTGKHSDFHEVQRTILGYDDIIAGYRKKRSYLDVAYFTGYQYAFVGLAMAKITRFEPPLHYYHPSLGPIGRTRFEKKFRSLPAMHKAAFEACRKVVANWPEGKGMVLQHPPWG